MRNWIERLYFFQPRLGRPPCRAYLLSRQANQEASSTFGIGNEWSRIRPLTKIMKGRTAIMRRSSLGKMNRICELETDKACFPQLRATLAAKRGVNVAPSEISVRRRRNRQRRLTNGVGPSATEDIPATARRSGGLTSFYQRPPSGGLGDLRHLMMANTIAWQTIRSPRKPDESLTIKIRCRSEFDDPTVCPSDPVVATVPNGRNNRDALRSSSLRTQTALVVAM
jgi:hypothetical protein